MFGNRTKVVDGRVLLFYPRMDNIAQCAQELRVHHVEQIRGEQWTDPSFVESRLTLDRLLSQTWIALMDADPNKHSDTLRLIARKLSSLKIHEVNDLFRVFVVMPRDDQVFRLWPSLVQQNCIQLKDDILKDTTQRVLIQAVEEAFVSEVERRRGNIEAFEDTEKVNVFRKCTTEEVFLKLLERNPDEIPATFVALARNENGKSVLDIAIEKGYLKATAMSQALGAHSETFDLRCFLDPSFQPMIDVLLDPQKSFPFDARGVIHEVTKAGKRDILRRMFECRVDRDLKHFDYPLCQALASNDPHVVQLVVDRMGIVGYSPMYEGNVALHFCQELVSMKRELTPLELEWLSLWCHVTIQDDQRGVVRLEEIEFLVQHHKGHAVIPLVLRILDVQKCALVDDAVAMANFFVQLDPMSPTVTDALRCALQGLKGTVEEQDEALHKLVRGLVRSKVSCHTTLVALCGMLNDEKLSLAHKLTLENGRQRTLIMQCLEYPPNVDALTLFLSRIPMTDKITLEVQNEIGNSALQQCLVEVSTNPYASRPYLTSISKCVDLLCQHGARVTDPSIVTPLYKGVPPVNVSLIHRVLPLDFDDVCWAMRHSDAKFSWIRYGSSNLCSLLFHRGRDAVDERMAGRPQDKYEYHRSLLRVSSESWSHVASYLPLKSLKPFSETCVRSYFSCLDDVVWKCRIPKESETISTARFYTSSRKIVEDSHHLRPNNGCRHRLVPSVTGNLVCVYCQ